MDRTLPAGRFKACRFAEIGTVLMGTPFCRLRLSPQAESNLTLDSASLFSIVYISDSTIAGPGSKMSSYMARTDADNIPTNFEQKWLVIDPTGLVVGRA